MGEITSGRQLRMGLARRTAVTVPLVLLLGFLSGSSVPAGRANAWYAALAKPAGTPPDSAFPVAWGLIYACLGAALALVLDARGARGRGAAVAAFAATLLLALAWMPVFFGAHRVGLALGVALGMEAAGSVTAALFARVRRAAAWLVVPFLLWTGYAAGLTWGIARLNPDAGLAPVPLATQVLG